MISKLHFFGLFNPVKSLEVKKGFFWYIISTNFHSFSIFMDTNLNKGCEGERGGRKKRFIKGIVVFEWFFGV